MRTTFLAVLGALALAAPASAFTEPEIFVRQQRAGTSHEVMSDWIPLASAPVVNYLGGFQIGYRQQDSDEPGDRQKTALVIASVPDGTVTQPLNSPYCSGGPATPGAIVPVGPEIQYEGNGTYTVKVSIGPSTGGQSDCLSGPTTTGSFSVDVHVAPIKVGDPLVFRLKPLVPVSTFVGLRADPPTDASADMRCARNATARPDGSLAEPFLSLADAAARNPGLSETDFKPPGAWICVARGTIEGIDADLNGVTYATPWSPPLAFDVRSDFRRADGRIAKGRSKRPTYTIAAEFPGAAAGGRGTLVLRRVARCRKAQYVYKKVATYRGTFDAKGRMKLTLKRPKPGFYAGTLAFAGTRFYTASTDPNLARFESRLRAAFSFANPERYPLCPGYRP